LLLVLERGSENILTRIDLKIEMCSVKCAVAALSIGRLPGFVLVVNPA